MTTPTPRNPRWCCKLACNADAEYEITAVRPTGTGFVTNAGPDPYSDYTDACEAHVGELLGYQTNASAPDDIFWEVRSLAPVIAGYTGPSEASHVDY